MNKILTAEKGEENNNLDEQSQTALLVLPEPGSQERLLAERKLVRKLDRRLLPTILIIYIVNYIDVRRYPQFNSEADGPSLARWDYYSPFARHTERFTLIRYVCLDVEN